MRSSNSSGSPLFWRGAGGEVVRLLALALLLLLSPTAHAQMAQADLRDSAEYTLRVAAKKTINNSTVDGKAGFSEYKNYPTRSMAQLQGFKPVAMKLSKYCLLYTSPSPRDS